MVFVIISFEEMQVWWVVGKRWIEYWTIYVYEIVRDLAFGIVAHGSDTWKCSEGWVLNIVIGQAVEYFIDTVFVAGNPISNTDSYWIKIFIVHDSENTTGDVGCDVFICFRNLRMRNNWTGDKNNQKRRYFEYDSFHQLMLCAKCRKFQWQEFVKIYH